MLKAISGLIRDLLTPPALTGRIVACERLDLGTDWFRIVGNEVLGPYRERSDAERARTVEELSFWQQF